MNKPEKTLKEYCETWAISLLEATKKGDAATGDYITSCYEITAKFYYPCSSQQERADTLQEVLQEVLQEQDPEYFECLKLMKKG